MVEQTLEWYQQGNWPLIGASLALLVTNSVVAWGIYTQVKANLITQLKVKRIERLAEQLSGFYNPLFSLILINQKLFKAAGPPSFPTDHIRRDTAGENWKLVLNKTIIPNNKIISQILRNNTHLVAENDSISNYHDLQLHLAMYEAFKEAPNEIYEQFQFPKKILRHVEIVREKLVLQFENAQEDKK